MAKGKGGNNNYCNYCKKPGHLQKNCRDDPKNNNNNNQNNNKNNNKCGYCGNNGHYEAYCDKKKQDAANTGAHSGYLMTAPWQISPPQPEALWCKWCNSLYHSTASCQDTNSKLEVIVMAESNSNRCDRCGYKGHVSTNCRNPHPEVKCIFCQIPGHTFQDCVRRTEPRIHEILASLPLDQLGLTVKKDESSHAMSNTITTFKRRREALDQSQKACNDFITNLVNATSNKETQDVIPVKNDELGYIMDGVLHWTPGADCNLWGKDLTETVKAMGMYHVAEGMSFFRIAYAIHRLEAGFNISCAHWGCKGSAMIITPEFQPVNVSTRSGYPRDQAEHAVFLATNCSHSFFAFEWRRSRIEQGDLTPLYLLQAAHSNPILNQYTELKAGITTRDLDLEYDAMLETEKRRQALDVEQQKIVETSRRLEFQEVEFRKHAERLVSPMDYKMNSPVTSTQNNNGLPPFSAGSSGSGRPPKGSGPSDPNPPSGSTGFYGTGSPAPKATPDHGSNPHYNPPNHGKKREWRDTVMTEAPAPFKFTKAGSGVSSPPKRSKPEYHRPVSDNVRPKGVEKIKKALSGKGVTVKRPEGKKGDKGGSAGEKGGRKGYSPRGGHTGASGGPSGGPSGGDSDDDQVL
ncbi:hypothetical protein KCU85_g8337, partial [Aureobasidium melanogenum]